jgi:tetratricopeptide (TPR) repeat protein
MILPGEGLTMAEGGLLKEFLEGGEGEAAEAEAAAAALDPAAAALAMSAARKHPGLAASAADYFRRQAHLVGIQTEHLHEQRLVQLSNLKLRGLSEVLKVSFQAVVALVAIVVGVVLLVMIHDAVVSMSVVVEPFEAPPALAARGLTGKVVAEDFLDELNRLQSAARSSAAKRNLSNAWAGDITVEVPETGVSLGEIERLLRRRLGHDQHVEGDLVQTEDGALALTVRGDGIIAKTFTGPSGELDRLTTQAAEYVFGQSEPYLYAIYLRNAGRYAEALAFAKAAYSTAPKSERPYLLNEWGNGLNNTGQPVTASLPLYLEALKLKPDYWIAYNNVMNVYWGMGREEDAWRLGEKLRKQAGGRPGKAPELFYSNWDTLTWNLAPWRASLEADAEAHGGVGTSIVSNGPSLADVDARMHDPQAAELHLQTSLGDAADSSIISIGHFVRGLLAGEAGDVQRAAAEMEAFGTAYEADPALSSNYPGYRCWIAPAEEAAGHPDKADAVLASAGSFVDCYRFRGDILDHRGDWAGAQKAYAAAVALAPDLPAAYYSWGQALARHGDLAGALAKLQAANRRGPTWADPLKAWGDVLARQGHWREALGKYDAALRHAPAWSALHRARDFAARRAT